jgi:hypothetical protein
LDNARPKENSHEPSMRSTYNHHKASPNEVFSHVSTRQVQSKIQKYAETIIPPALLSLGVNLNSIQLDHLKTLIKKLEDDALESKRIA